ncbi:hypothetical protein HKD37_04G010804 [Glycine soja]
MNFPIETKWIGEKAKEMDTIGFKLWYIGKIRGNNNVGIMVDKVWKEKTINIINAYEPYIGIETHVKEKFWENLEGLVQGNQQEEKFFLGGGLNGHVGSQKRQFTCAHGGFGFRGLTTEGQTIIDFSMAYDVKIMKTCLEKREEHLITYKSGSSSVDKRACKDCKELQGNANLIWDDMAKKIRKVAKEILGDSKEIRNLDGGMKRFKKRLKSKERASKSCRGGTMLKIGQDIGMLGMRQKSGK